jgi:hypothetical protein
VPRTTPHGVVEACGTHDPGRHGVDALRRFAADHGRARAAALGELTAEGVGVGDRPGGVAAQSAPEHPAEQSGPTVTEQHLADARAVQRQATADLRDQAMGGPGGQPLDDHRRIALQDRQLHMLVQGRGAACRSFMKGWADDRSDSVNGAGVPSRHIPGGRQVNLVAAAPTGDCATESWSATTTVKAFLAEFDGWDPRITGLIRAGGAPARRALLDRAPLTHWSEGCVVTLLGDAAHPMFPFFGQGAAQALEVAAVVARLLADHSDDPALALRRYEETRVPRTTRLQTVSHGRAHINHLPDGPEQRARDAAYAAQDPLAANGWIHGYDPDKELREVKEPKELGEGNRP